MSVYGRGATGWTPPPRRSRAEVHIEAQLKAQRSAETQRSTDQWWASLDSGQVIDMVEINGVWQERK